MSTHLDVPLIIEMMGYLNPLDLEGELKAAIIRRREAGVGYPEDFYIKALDYLSAQAIAKRPLPRDIEFHGTLVSAICGLHPKAGTQLAERAAYWRKELL